MLPLLLKHLQPDGPITGTFRVTAPRCKVSIGGTQYLTLELTDCSGTIRAFGWPERYTGPTEPGDLSLVKVTGASYLFHERKLVDLHRIEPVTSVAEPVLLITPNCCPVIAGVERLRELLERITVPALRNFNNTVLADDALALPFLRLPASRRHHHSFPGGLVTHSQECAEIIADLALDLPRQTRELGMVAALWHDIGKIKTLDPRPGAWLTGAVLKHDALTLELLAPALANLDRDWREGALMLRYLFTWNKCGKPGRPLQVIAEAVESADRISSGLSAERLAFADAEHWKKLAKWQGSRYVRLGCV